MDVLKEAYAHDLIDLDTMERILDNLWGLKDPLRSLDQEYLEIKRLEVKLNLRSHSKPPPSREFQLPKKLLLYLFGVCLIVHGILTQNIATLLSGISLAWIPTILLLDR